MKERPKEKAKEVKEKVKDGRLSRREEKEEALGSGSDLNGSSSGRAVAFKATATAVASKAIACRTAGLCWRWKARRKVKRS